jgi:hypothetical protein
MYNKVTDKSYPPDIVRNTLDDYSKAIAMTKHKTFPGQQPEIPAPGKKPEIERPYDPKEPEVPEEDPERIPEELPTRANPPEEPPLNPGSLS